MTQPNPAPVVPANQPEPPAVPTTGQPTDPAGAQPSAFDPSSLSPEAQAYLKSQVEAAGFKARDNARTKTAEEARQQLMTEFAQKLGFAEANEPPSAEDLSAHLEQAQSTAYQAGVETQMYRLGSRLGFDAEALLDSKRAMDDLIDALDENEGAGDLVPGSREFAAALEVAVAKVLEKHPRLKAGGTAPGPRPDPSQGTRGAGPGDVDSQIAEAQAKGDWRTVLSLQNNKLANLKP